MSSSSAWHSRVAPLWNSSGLQLWTFLSDKFDKHLFWTNVTKCRGTVIIFISSGMKKQRNSCLWNPINRLRFGARFMFCHEIVLSNSFTLSLIRTHAEIWCCLCRDIEPSKRFSNFETPQQAAVITWRYNTLNCTGRRFKRQHDGHYMLHSNTLTELHD